jgi:hypothetical protein
MPVGNSYGQTHTIGLATDQGSNQTADKLHRQKLDKRYMKIVSCSISAMPVKLFDPMPQVTVTYENGTHEMLFEYYPDEISFTSSEFIGKTKQEALQLFHKKDVDYLQS